MTTPSPSGNETPVTPPPHPGMAGGAKKARVALYSLLTLVIIALVAVGVTLYLRSLQSGQVKLESAGTCSAEVENKHPLVDKISDPDLGPAAQTEATIAWAEPAQYQQGRGIWVSGGKVLDNAAIDQALAKKLPVVEIYYDYTCNFCNDLEQIHSQEFQDLATSGQAVLVYRPVLTHNGPLALPGNEVAYWVAAHEPEKFMAFQEHLQALSAKYFNSTALEKMGQVQQSYLKGQGLDIDKLCQAIDQGDEQAQGLYYYTTPLQAIDQALEAAGIDPTQVEIPNNALYSPAAVQLFSERMEKAGNKAGTPKVFLNGKEVTSEIFSDEQGVTKLIK